MSAVVRSQFGFHIIQLVERKDGTVKPFEMVSPDIGSHLAITYADTVARRTSEQILRAAKTGPGLAKLAGDRNLASQFADWYEGLPLTGVAMIDDLRRDAASTRPGELLPGVYHYVTEGYAVVALDSVLAPRQQTFDLAESRALEESRREARQRVATERADRLEHDLAAGVPWDKAIETVGGEIASGPFAAGQGLPTVGSVPGLDSLVFGPGPDTLKTGGWARLANPRGDLFLHLDERVPAPPAEVREARTAVANALLNRRIYDYVETLRKQHAVAVLRPDLAARIPPPPLN